jgi:ADP-ribose pyrophosphatase YjhB (NUDIX family)
MTHWRDRFSVVPAVYVIFRDEDKMLLLQRSNTGYRDGEYSLPAGHLDGGEPAVIAAVREAKEEAGVDIDPADLELVYTQHRVAEEGDHERINLFFEAKRWEGKPHNAEPHKCSELRWEHLDTMPGNLVPEVQNLLQGLAEGRSYGHFGF